MDYKDRELYDKDPDLMHKKVEKLWHFLQEQRVIEDDKDHWLTMDPWTYSTLNYSKAANQDGSFRYFESHERMEEGVAPLRWREIKIRFLTITSDMPASIADMEAVSMNDICYPPFCLYMTMVKMNDRRLYWDDPDCEKQYV